MDQIKISQLTERTDIEGVEMIPIQIGDLNYKVSVDTIVQRSKEILHAYQQYTYDELKQLKDSKLLIPGEHYLLTDYQCIYKQPISEEIVTCDYDGWLIMLLATSEDTFSNDAHIFFTEDSTYITNGGVPIIECKYVFDNFSDYDWSDTSSKGIIVGLKDYNHNKCSYDFKHIKFRRWALKDVTENDTVGTADQPSVYRCYGTAEEPKRSDGRSWVGSGLLIERDYIRSIFDGTFNSVMWGQDALHEDYITYVHKAFKRTDVNLQYVVYNTDTSSISNLTAAVPGLVKFEIDSSDYIDCYTFECDGEDYSNYANVLNNRISCNSKYTLPNTVILFASDEKENVAGNVWNNNLNAKNVTFAFHGIEDYYPLFNRVTASDLRNSIFNCFRIYQTQFEDYCASNYVSGSLYDCTLEGTSNSVLFGYYNSVRFGSCTYNLLFGNEQRICKSDGTWGSPADGNYWYDDITQEWFGYNIMGPFQYSVFYPHTNTNTVKMPYNKGVTLMGTFQDNFVERMRWGAIVQYGAVQGNYMGEIVGTVISPSAFKSQVAHSSGESAIYTLEGATQLTSIMNTDVKGYQMDTKSLQNNLTDEQKTMLKERSRRKVLFVENSVPYVKYYSELATGSGTGGSSVDLSNYYNKSEVDELLTQVTVDLSDYYNKEQVDEIVSNIKVDLTGYATEQWVEEKGYLTEHQDLTGYALTSDLTSGLLTKVDKVEGKQLTTEDFTTALKTKLEGLSNYDDAEINQTVETLRSDFDTLVNGDSTTAIKSFNEIIAFLEGIEDSENLDSIIASIEQQIATTQSSIPTKTSQLTNDSSFLIEIPAEYITESELTAMNFATQSDIDAINTTIGNINTMLDTINGEVI